MRSLMPTPCNDDRSSVATCAALVCESGPCLAVPGGIVSHSIVGHAGHSRGRVS
jgi:hypothetical protein